MRNTAVEVVMNSLETYSCGPPHKQRQDDQLEPTHNSTVAIQNVALKTYRIDGRERRVAEDGQGDSD